MKDTYCSVCGIKMGTCPDDWEGGGICQDCCPTCRRPVGQTQLDTLRSLVREMGKIIEYIETHGIEHFKPEIQKRIADALNCPEVKVIMEGER